MFNYLTYFNTRASLVAHTIKNLPVMRETRVWSPGSRSPGEGNGYPVAILQYYCLENSTGRRTWWTAVHGVAESQTWLSNQHCHSPEWSVAPVCFLHTFLQNTDVYSFTCLLFSVDVFRSFKWLYWFFRYLRTSDENRENLSTEA